jgi:hypothetical protein
MTEGEKAGPAPDFEKLLNAAVSPIMERLTALEQIDKQLNSDAETIKTFKVEQEASKLAAKKDTYKKLLNAAAQADFDKLYSEMDKDLAGWQVANPDKLFHPVPETKLGSKILNSDGSEWSLKAEQAKLFGY